MIDIASERVKQDKKWGGPAHDDQHTRNDWLDIIDEHLVRAHDGTDTIWRKQMVRVAAIAIAAIDAEDRRRERDA